MRFYKVSAICIDRDRLVAVENEDGSLFVRDEVIDTQAEFFNDCKNEYEVEDRYESFWNRMNADTRQHMYCNRDIVKVLEVKECA